MAPNSSSVFNEAPTEAKPPSSSPETSMAPPTDARPVTSMSTSPAAVPSSSDCPTKQAAPKMEATVEDAKERSDETRSSLRFERVVSMGLEDAKKTLVHRKSCLKPSSSFLPSSFPEIPAETPKREPIVEEKPKEPAAPIQKNRRRCWECKAKVGLTALTCKCDYTFCSKHRYAEEHNCKFNFKSAAKRKLEDENPRVVPAKVARIN